MSARSRGEGERLLSRSSRDGSELSVNARDDDGEAGAPSPVMRRSIGASPFQAPMVHQTCPTCHGKGRVPRDAMNREELIALIPVRDKRLRPKRTKCVIGVTFGFTALLIGSIVFVTYPREVNLSLVAEDATTDNLTVACYGKDKREIEWMNMTLRVMVHFSNHNFLPVATSKNSFSILTARSDALVGQTRLSSFTLPSGLHADREIAVNVSLATRDASLVWKSCRLESRIAQFFVHFVAHSTAKLISLSDDLNIDTIMKVVCPKQNSSALPPCMIPSG